MQLWDTPGNQLMRACLPVWIKAAKVVLLVFSVAGDVGLHCTVKRGFVLTGAAGRP